MKVFFAATGRKFLGIPLWCGVTFLFLLQGCTSTWYITEKARSNEPYKLTYPQAQKQLSGEKVSILLENGLRIEGRITEIASDSIRIWNDAGAAGNVYPTNQVKSIKKTDHMSGAVTGCFSGSLGGILVGGVLAGALIPQGGGGDMSGLGVAMISIAGGAIGFLGGTIYGAVSGNVVCYIFADTSAMRKP